MNKPQMVPGWAKKIEDAQRLKRVDVGGVMSERVPYGKEKSHHQGARLRLWCHDCAASLGQLHVPGCCVEACPRCKTGQAFGCPCSEYH
jgi:hypothetical protein